MAQHLAVYTVIHQPRRLRLPAAPIPTGAPPEQIASLLFDEAMDRRYFERVARRCYHPATWMFREMADQGFKLSLGMSLSFLRQAELWDPALVDLFRDLVTHPNVELVGVEPYHSFLFYLDLPAFMRRMDWMRDELERTFGRRPVVTDTTEMFISNDLYYALRAGGWSGVVMDGREWVLGENEPTHLYRYHEGPHLFCRHYRLSDDVGFRFSDRRWSGWPLRVGDYAGWIRSAAGELVFLAWDYETFGEHHAAETGIFEFMRSLPGELSSRGMELATLSEIRERYATRSRYLPLPAAASTWAGAGGGVEFFLGNSAQQTVFQLMHHAYHKAQLTGNPALVDLAMWLCQSDNLHLIQWYGREGDEAAVSAYFTPKEWWPLGPQGIVSEIQNVYGQFIRALDGYLDKSTVPAGGAARAADQAGSRRNSSARPG